MTSKIVFFGSGPVAAASLRLLAEDFTIEAVVTKPRPAHHKGSVPVLEAAAELNLLVLEAANKIELSQLIAEQTFASPVGVLIDFGIIVTQDVIDSFPKGIINSHFSLLPEWRGADPITFALLSGQKQTGVSLMQLVPALDEGDVLSVGVYEITDDITGPAMTDDLVQLSHSLLADGLPKYIDDKLIPVNQTAVADEFNLEVSYSRKLTKADSVLDFTTSAAELERQVRAFIDWPRSRTKIHQLDVVITKAHVQSGEGEPGKLYREGKAFGFYTTHGIFVIDELKPAGKNTMPAEAFLAGYGQLLQ